MTRRALCTAFAALLAITAAGCGRQVEMTKKEPVTTAYPQAVDAYTELESSPDSTAEESAAEENTAETSDEKKETKKPKKTEETTTTTEPEPEEPDIRREQPYLGAAENDDFSDACFIGASQTVGLSLFGGKVKPDFYAYAGLTVKTVFTKKFLDENGRAAAVSDEDGGSDLGDDLFTVLDLVEKKEYGRIYILFGINEIGWADRNEFYDDYTKLISTLRRSQPNAHIYIESLLPVNKYAVETNTIFTNENIDSFNRQYVKAVADATGCTYLNVNPLFKCENGSLARDAASDGIHLISSYCLEWMDMLAYYSPVTGPRSDMPKDYEPYATSPSTETRAPGELPPQVLPQDLPDVIIPDVTTAPAATAPPETTPQTETETQAPAEDNYDDYNGYYDENGVWQTY